MKKIILIALLTTICPAGYSHDIVKGADGREYLNYEVQRGDYLAKISLVTGVKVADIKAVNGEDVETLKIGQVIRIPMPEGYAARAAKAKEMVVRGEVYIELLADKEGSSLNFLRARTALMVASILDPLSADAWHKLGFLYANAYDSEYAYYALACYERFLRLENPDSKRAAYVKNTAVPKLKQTLVVKTTEMLGSSPRDELKCKERIVKAEEAAKNGNLKLAKMHYRMAAHDDPLSFDAVVGLARVEKDLMEDEFDGRDALANYRKAIALRPKAIDVCLEAGVCATQLNKLQLGKVFYSLALAIDPCNEAAMKGITKAYYDQGKVKEAQVYNAYQIEFGGLDLVPVGSDRR